MEGTNRIKVWDPLVRIFHWALVVTFVTAYATGEDLHEVHEWLGYTVLGLVVFRVVWGFVGPAHARFADFLQGPAEVLRNLKDVVLMRPKRYLGHSPAGGAMVILLLALLAATAVTGIFVDEQREQKGPEVAAASPPAGYEARARSNGGERDEDSAIEEVHETLANVTLALVLLHVAGVILASFTHRENLVASMFSGRKRV
jgi:cytochrome b